MRHILIAFLTVQYFTAFSQTFETIDSLQIKADNIIDGQWADIDNDGSLEYVALLKKTDSISVNMFSIADGVISDSVIFAKRCLSAQFEIADFTQDGLLDILLSTKSTTGNNLEIYVNNSALAFQTEIIKIDSFYVHNLQSIDFTRNGAREILTIIKDNKGSYKIKLYAYQDEIKVWDTLSVEFSEEISYKEFLNIDIDKDGWNDLIIGGKDQDDNPVIELYENNKGELKRITHDLEYPALLKMSKADLNADGDFEVIHYGKIDGGASLYYYDNNNAVFTKDTFGVDPDSVLQFFAADFNSDGLSDIILKSITTASTKNQLMLNDGDMNFTLEDITLADWQDFGDWDWDGDLDIIQFQEVGDSVKIFLLDNTTVESNSGPNNTAQSLVFPQFKAVTILWDSVEDDHTSRAAITYDLYIEKEYTDAIVSPGFDIDYTYRTVVAHGNQNTLLSSSYYDLAVGIYEYGIQTVDNAFYAIGGRKGAPGGGGGGSGGIHRGKFVICDSVSTHQYIICISEEVTLVPKSGKEGAWYSSIQGYLGMANFLELTIVESEEIYFAVQQSLECEDQEVWLFDVRESGEIDSLPDIWKCKGELLEFEIGDFWKHIQWKSSQRGGLGTSIILSYVADQIDTITVNVESYQGCTFEDTFIVNISTPKITLSGEFYRILKGKSVHLAASGGASYEWTPAQWLTDPLIPNPIASPEKTILYTVEVTDSIGCVIVGAVQVIIETNAFIPNLFTPNQDQRNDVLKIYGLEEVSHFTFMIYNRSGNLVYESSDINEVTTQGWDGTKKGKPQPNGVYYWKITGAYKNENTVYLNGESSGAVHLLR